MLSKTLENLLAKIPAKHSKIGVTWENSMANGDTCYGRPIGFNTRRIYLNAASKFWKEVEKNFSNLHEATIKAIESCNPDQYSTRRHIKEAAISLCKFLIHEHGDNEISKETLKRLRDIKIKRFKEPHRPTLREEDLTKLLAVNEDLDTTRASKELNKILILTAFYTGMRVSEIVDLKLEDIYE